MVISPAEIPASLQFNAVEWFSQFSADGKPIDSTELQPILEFTLLWSLFERETCDRFVRLVDLRKHVDEASAKDQLMRDAYEPYLRNSVKLATYQARWSLHNTHRDAETVMKFCFFKKCLRERAKV
jgi:hypothetical protein